MPRIFTISRLGQWREGGGIWEGAVAGAAAQCRASSGPLARSVWHYWEIWGIMRGLAMRRDTRLSPWRPLPLLPSPPPFPRHLGPHQPWERYPGNNVCGLLDVCPPSARTCCGRTRHAVLGFLPQIFWQECDNWAIPDTPSTTKKSAPPLGTPIPGKMTCECRMRGDDLPLP